MQLLAAVVYHHLPAVEVGDAEGGRNIDDGSGFIARMNIEDADKALHVGQGQGKEGRVHGADHQTVVAVVFSAGVEGQHDELLGGQPVQRLLAQLGEGIAVGILKAGLIGGQLVADAHTVGVTAAHIVLHEVDHRAVLAADYLSLLEKALPGDGVGHVVPGAVGGSEAHLKKLVLCLRVAEAAAFLQGLPQFLGEYEAVKIRIRIHKRTPFLVMISENKRFPSLLRFYHFFRKSSTNKTDGNRVGTARLKPFLCSFLTSGRKKLSFCGFLRYT